MDIFLNLELLDDIKKVLEGSGIRSLLNFMWLIFKTGHQKLVRTKNFKHYENYPTLTSIPQLTELYAMELATKTAPYRTYMYYKSQDFSVNRMIMTYMKDPFQGNPNYLSYSMKMNRLMRDNKNIVLDLADESNFSKPAFYVMKEQQKITIVIRGTANKSDKMQDVNAQPMLVEDFYVHPGFYWHAQTIFEELERAKLIEKDYQYITTGHSMGGAIACLVAFLLFQHVTQNVKGYGFGMAAVGNERFAEYCKAFFTCIINGFDMVPTITLHACKAQNQRLLYENSKKFEKEDDEHIKHKIKKGEFVLQNAKIGEYVDVESAQIFETLSGDPLPKEISEKCAKDDDLYPAGQIYHYILGKFFQVSVHDLAEFQISETGMLDHFCYIWVAEEIEKMLEAHAAKENK